MLLKQLVPRFRMAHGVELELKLEQHLPGFKDARGKPFLENFALLFRRKPGLLKTQHFRFIFGNRLIAEREERGFLIGEVGIERAAAAPGFGGDVLNACGFKTIARKTLRAAKRSNLRVDSLRSAWREMRGAMAARWRAIFMESVCRTRQKAVVSA